MGKKVETKVFVTLTCGHVKTIFIEGKSMSANATTLCKKCNKDMKVKKFN